MGLWRKYWPGKSLLLATNVAALAVSFNAVADEWPAYGGDAGGMRYSSLAQINRDNVSRLKVSWVFHTGDISDGKGERKRSGFETTPILVDGALYLTTPFNRVIALDPETGKQRWAHDPKTQLSWDYGDGLINRGVAIWPAPNSGESGEATPPPRRRIFEATLDARLIALDAKKGAPCLDFGQDGQVSLREIARYSPGQYHMTAPPVVIDDLVVVGSAIDDNSRVDMPSGVVRAFDARSGALRWRWEPIPPNGTTHSPAGTWRTGAANAWAVMVVDSERRHPPVSAGAISLGGPIVTAGGLVFIAGTVDPFVRAFDIETGRELWKAPLPASGAATPMTYMTKTGRRQFLVIAAGGHAQVTEEPQSDALVAFALP